MTDSSDWDADGITGSIETFTYDTKGNKLTSIEHSRSFIMDGIVHGRVEHLAKFTYDAVGNLLTYSGYRSVGGDAGKFSYDVSDNLLTYVEIIV